MQQQDDSQSAQPESRNPSLSGHRTLNSKDILEGAKEVWIMHGDEVYRLRETRSGKLILSK